MGIELLVQSAGSEELPAPSAELILWRIHVEAMLTVLGRKKGERYLTLMAEKLADEENLASIFQIRPASHRGATRRATAQAAELFARSMPLFLARLPGK